MIDPVSNIPLQRMSAPTASNSKHVEKSQKRDTSDDIKNQALQDSVSFQMNLQGDLSSLQDSVSTLMKQVKEQLERSFGVPSDEENKQTGEFLPPEDASAQEVADFFSPENTAERIVGFSTHFLDSFLQNHPDASEEDNVNEFTSLIGDAIKKGFDEAEKILGSFDKLGDIGENIKKTYKSVLQGLEKFRLQYLNDLGLIPEKEPTKETSQPEEFSDLDIVG